MSYQLQVACLLATVVALPAYAQSKISDFCPNAPTALSVTFPLDLPAETTGGSATVEFTIDADGSILDVRAIDSSDVAFGEPAVSAIRLLKCQPRESPVRFSLQLDFKKPKAVPVKQCPKYVEAMIELATFRRRVMSGSAWYDFTVQRNGEVTDVAIVRSTSKVLSAELLRALESVRCYPSDEDAQRVRGSLSFN